MSQPDTLLVRSKYASGKAPKMVHDHQQEMALVARIKDGDEAERQLIELYWERIRRTAEGYYHPGMHLEVEDLMQEGAIALLQAARSYEPGSRTFSGWVSPAIANGIRRAIFQKERPVPLPENIEFDVARILKRQEQLQREFGRKPTMKELAQAVAAHGEWLHGADWRGYGYFRDPRQDSDPLVNDLIWIFNWLNVVSIEELRPDVRGEPVNLEEEAIEAADCSVSYEVVRRSLDRLPERARRILELRFGFYSEEPWRLEEIGQELDMTRERVRQLENESLQKLLLLMTGAWTPRSWW